MTVGCVERMFEREYQVGEEAAGAGGWASAAQAPRCGRWARPQRPPRLAHLPRRSVHRHTPAWRLVLRAHRHFLHTLASPVRRFSLLPTAQFPAPSQRPSRSRWLSTLPTVPSRFVNFWQVPAFVWIFRGRNGRVRRRSRFREVGGSRCRRTLAVGRGCGRKRRVRGLEEAAGTLFPPQLGCVSYVPPCACCPPLFLQPAPHPHQLQLPLPFPLPLALPLQALDPQVAKHQRLRLSNMVSANLACFPAYLPAPPWALNR